MWLEDSAVRDDQLMHAAEVQERRGEPVNERVKKDRKE
jgi:hypothetical protein